MFIFVLIRVSKYLFRLQLRKVKDNTSRTSWTSLILLYSPLTLSKSTIIEVWLILKISIHLLIGIADLMSDIWIWCHVTKFPKFTTKVIRIGFSGLLSEITEWKAVKTMMFVMLWWIYGLGCVLFVYTHLTKDFYKSSVRVRDILDIINFTNYFTWLFFNKYPITIFQFPDYEKNLKN